ncbi:aspartate aminotransferase family protein [Nitrosomonas sp.]|uniref:aspartate aminotransferase family protein n=1 Tax=Nitrosomonas sp. TaxID=42353 RepID=UPI001DC9F2A3|nr:aspartate aminotransferase family protein [Nitrosomonas sp.]MCB1949054.1 aspartate aminotransferase family protein [Nitrosomonas sp.]MCP5242123.1 aspartate aminotransferase family protein [Burkholderiales bacterium]MDR4514684.1 aspartate aminotransferase family protein [Nitrosomonas sp.]
MSYVMNTYAQLPVTFVKGEGVWLWSDRGEKYLDALSGVAVCGLGHCHPRLAEALCKQARTLMHTSNIYFIEKQEQLAARLTALSGMEKAFFCNSGAEANEAAIKLARLYGHNKGVSLPTIIVMEHAFHGRTMATLTATGNRKVQAGFEPLLSGFVRVPYNNLEAVRQVAVNNKNVVAVLVEPFQGEGGVNIPQARYLRELRSLCDEYGWLLMLDEVQSGIGRSGKWFAFQHSDILPDVMTLAKGLGSGVPIGSCLAQGVAANTFKPGNHASTFGGNPLVCAAAIETLAVLEDDDLINHASELGSYIHDQLENQLAGVDKVVEIRSQGLMIGIELALPCGELVKRALDKKLLINVTSERVIRLLPALVMQQQEAKLVVDTICQLIKEFVEAR